MITIRILNPAWWVVILLAAVIAVPSAKGASGSLAQVDRSTIVAEASAIPRLHALIVAQDGMTIIEQRFRGPALDRPVNIKSVSKSILSALAGIAIQAGILTGTDQRVASILGEDMPADGDRRLQDITIGNLLSMQAGLGSTSGGNYGAWVLSPNWVRYALDRPFEADPGGRMIYSTGTSHLLSVALTKASGRSTLGLVRTWLGEPLDITIPAWPRDPQGIYFGGNDMLLSPQALVRFGELYRNDGKVGDRRVLPNGWVATSWTKRTVSAWTGDDYGYGWFTRVAGRSKVHFAWGYGGQMVFVVPDLALTVVMTSDPTPRPRGDGHLDDLHRLLEQQIVPAFGGSSP